MVSLLPSHIFGRNLDRADSPSRMDGGSQDESLAESPADLLADALEQVEESTIMRTLGWVSAGLGALALGLVVGRELRQRYKFNRRTPYDFYAHSGDEVQDVEFGVGV